MDSLSPLAKSGIKQEQFPFLKADKNNKNNDEGKDRHQPNIFPNH